MALIIIDTITSILLSIAFACTISSCIDTREEVKREKIFVMAVLFFITNEFFTGILGVKWLISIFLTHIFSLIITAAFYRKKIHYALVAYTIGYFIFGMCFCILGNFINKCTGATVLIENVNIWTIFVNYIPKLLLLLIYFEIMGKIKKIYKFIFYEKFSTVFILMSFILDFILTSYYFNLWQRRLLIKNITCIILLICFVVALVYFWKIHQKSEQICKLNEALEVKNNELRKIKHDYGAQISYLYGLCLMNRFDGLKKSLRDIINSNESTPTAVEVSTNDESLLSRALKPAVDMGIHVIIDENCKFAFIDMTQVEFYKVLSDIVSNAIKAMNGEGIIIGKSYEYLGNAVIKIENNRAKIHENDLDKILKFRFSTREDNDNNNGYGLSVARDLVEKCNGKISVRSSKTAIEFKIILPIIKKKIEEMKETC